MVKSHHIGCVDLFVDEPTAILSASDPASLSKDVSATSSWRTPTASGDTCAGPGRDLLLEGDTLGPFALDRRDHISSVARKPWVSPVAAVSQRGRSLPRRRTVEGRPADDRGAGGGRDAPLQLVLLVGPAASALLWTRRILPATLLGGLLSATTGAAGLAVSLT